MIKNVLFDLDGTLLPMDNEGFGKIYFKNLCARMAPLGYEPEALTKAVMAGIAAMFANDGSRINEEVFWQSFCGIFGENARGDAPAFEDFYKTTYLEIRNICSFTPMAAETVKMLRERGIRVGLATNPVFPAVATRARIGWAGLSYDDFEIVTTFENSSFCKPNPEYYLDICKKLNMLPEETFMVGNDAEEDCLAGERAGLSVFLLKDCLLNKKGLDISGYRQGGFPELFEYLKTL